MAEKCIEILGAFLCRPLQLNNVSVPGSRKTASFEEQVIPKDKYPSIFSRQIECYCVYFRSISPMLLVYLFIFRNTRVFENGKYHSARDLGNTQSRDALKPVASERKYFVDYK